MPSVDGVDPDSASLLGEELLGAAPPLVDVGDGRVRPRPGVFTKTTPGRWGSEVIALTSAVPASWSICVAPGVSPSSQSWISKRDDLGESAVDVHRPCRDLVVSLIELVAAAQARAEREPSTQPSVPSAPFHSLTTRM